MNTKRFIGGAFVLPCLFATCEAKVQLAHLDSPSCLSYQVVHGWPNQPAGEMLGEVAGVGVDSQGNVFVFHGADRIWPEGDALDMEPIAHPTIMVFDGQSGSVLAHWGKDRFAMPHGLTIDNHDNVWLTDVALQQVYKFSNDGQLLLTLGERGIAGNDAGHFNRPTGVAVAADGSFYVSDGYLNARIVKYSAAGEFLFQWGTDGSGPGQFDLPHGITLDASGHVYVAGRGNARIQIFDESGQFLSQWSARQLGRPYAIAISRNGKAYIADGGDQPYSPPDRSAFVVVRITDGIPLARVGRFGNGAGQFRTAHAIAVDAEGSVYVGDVTPGRVQKFVRSADNGKCMPSSG